MPIKKIFSQMRNTNTIYVILIIGVAVMLLSTGMNRDEGKKETKKPEAVQTISDEEKLKDILSQVEGVGKVSVMITYYGSSEKALAYETKTDKGAQTSNGAGGESKDERAVMSDGAPVVVRDIYPEVKGVVVIAEGAGSPAVKQAICEAVSTSLGIAIHRICVLPKTG